MNEIIRKIKCICKIIILMPFRLVPIKNNKILICNNYGKGYGDNPKYICNELIKKSRKFDIVWALTDITDEMPEGIRKVKYKSFLFFYEMATAKVWIDNYRKYQYMKKRKGQFYIQTWHGDVGLKKSEGDAEQSLSETYIRDAKNDSMMIDVFVSGNTFMTRCIRRAFWYSGKVAEIGSPRRDVLYSASKSDVARIKKILNLDLTHKLFLYAPTFRHGEDRGSLEVCRLDWKQTKVALERRFGGIWTGMVRLHPNLAAYYDDLRIPDDVVNVNNYPDMQELLLIADCCISDYSSSLFEFAVTGKIGFIYAEDISAYIKERLLA